jgi:membrane protein DedA with SNARE-associated domain
MMRMPVPLFYIANILSALFWAPALLISGALIERSVVSSSHTEIVVIAAAGAIAAIIVYWARRRYAPARK